MSELIRSHSGRVVDAVGDNLLAEFSSVVDTVQCAVEIQKDLQQKNTDLPTDKRLEFRIGVNIGDVIQEGNHTAQLIDELTGHHLCAERYDRTLKNIFALQDEITLAIIRAMQVELESLRKAGLPD